MGEIRVTNSQLMVEYTTPQRAQVTNAHTMVEYIDPGIRVTNFAIETEYTYEARIAVTNFAVMAESTYENKIAVTNFAIMVEWRYVYHKPAFLEGSAGVMVRNSKSAFLDHDYLHNNHSALVWGGQIEVYTHPVYTRGSTGASGSKSAWLWGMPQDIKSAYLKGGSFIHFSNVGIMVETKSYQKQRLSNIALNIEYHMPDNQRLSNIAAQVEWHYGNISSKSAFVNGVVDFEVSWAVLATPDFTSWYVASSNDAYIHGETTARSRKSAYTINAYVDRDSTPAYVRSWNGVSPSHKDAYIHGDVNTRDAQAAYVHSGTVARNTGNPAYLWGQPGSTKSAFIDAIGHPMATAAGIMIETQPPHTVRVTDGGIVVESTSRGFVRITVAGITYEWVAATSAFGPDVWII